jgi:hypothetical protein
MKGLREVLGDGDWQGRDARWFVFKPKIPFWVKFLGSCNGKCWYILCPLRLFYGHWKYVMAIWCILWSFGIFSPFWFFVPRKIWQPCGRAVTS